MRLGFVFTWTKKKCQRAGIRVPTKRQRAVQAENVGLPRRLYVRMVFLVFFSWRWYSSSAISHAMYNTKRQLCRGGSRTQSVFMYVLCCTNVSVVGCPCVRPTRWLLQDGALLCRRRPRIERRVQRVNLSAVGNSLVLPACSAAAGEFVNFQSRDWGGQKRRQTSTHAWGWLSRRLLCSFLTLLRVAD